MTIGAALHPTMLPMLPIHLATALTTVTSSGVVPATSSVAATARLFGRAAGSSCGDFRGAKASDLVGDTRVSTGVVAAEDLPVNVTTTEFPAEDLVQVLSDDQDMALQIRLSSRGELVCDHGDGSCSWVAAAHLADDVHSCNVLLQAAGSQLQLRQRHRLLLRTVRPLRRGQRALLWFSEELLVPLNLPFLLPANIQGEKGYICHQCRRQFEAPNPLKLHLALNCGSQSIRHLWRRLLRPTTPSPPPPPSPPHLLSTSPCGAFRPYAVSSLPKNLTKTPPRNHNCHDSLASSAIFLSSHLPFSPLNLSRLPSEGLPLRPLFLHPAVDSPPVTNTLVGPSTPASSHQERRNQVAVPSISSYHQHATDMETLVSNLGTSKQGHLCIYCGKVYSRKYGLKIHIRTHTGFKPLRCKFCFRPFGDPSNLNKHVRLHAEGKTPYRCNVCGKVLVRRRDLERHVKSRHGGQGLDDDADASDSGDVETDEICEVDELTKEEKDA